MVREVSESERLQRYDILHRSLRENLVPFDVWRDKVYTVESNPAFRVVLEPTVDVSNSFMVPYPYKFAAVEEYIVRRYGIMNQGDRLRMIRKGLSQEDMQKASDVYINRVRGFMKYRVSTYLVSQIDEDYDSGVFIHQFSGAIHPFKYSELKSVECTSMLNMARTLLWAHGLYKRVSEDRSYVPPVDEYNEMHRAYNRPYAFTARCIMRLARDNSYYNVDTVEASLTDYAGFLSITDYQSVCRYIASMLQSHAKCIVTL